MDRSRIRAIVATIERQLLRLSTEATPANHETTTGELVKSFDELVAVLALGPEPEMRACPACHRTVRRTATLCGYCWVKLTTPAPGSNGGFPH